MLTDTPVLQERSHLGTERMSARGYTSRLPILSHLNPSPFLHQLPAQAATLCHHLLPACNISLSRAGGFTHPKSNVSPHLPDRSLLISVFLIPHPAQYEHQSKTSQPHRALDHLTVVDSIRTHSGALCTPQSTNAKLPACSIQIRA